MDAMTSDWTRLGAQLKEARSALGMEQQDVAVSIGVKRGALYNIENGLISKVTSTVLAYARLVGWADGSVQDVLAGGEPTPGEPPPAAPPGPEPDCAAGPDIDEGPAGLSLLVREALREGPLLGSRVEEVVTPTGRVRATIVIRGEDGTPPEDLLAALRSLRINVTLDE